MELVVAPLDEDGMDTQLARALHRIGRLELATLRAALDEVRRTRKQGEGPTLARTLAQRGLITEAELQTVLAQLRRVTLNVSGEGTFEMTAPKLPPKEPAAESQDPPPDETPTQHVKPDDAPPPEQGPAESFRPGGRVGNFIIERQAGAGAMGLVFVARDTATGAQVALKTVRMAVREDPQLVERFRREADVLAKVDGHENVVRVLETASAHGRPYFVMELIEGGGSLADRVRRCPLAIIDAARILGGVARGLAHLHARGVLHRDVKPANIVLDAAGLPKLVDFGLASAAGNSRLTISGELMGTPQFMAPEQVIGGREDVGPWTDMWAFGAVLFYALVGRPGFTSTNAIALLEEISTREPPSLIGARPDTPRAFDALYRACLSKDTRARPHAAEVARTLDGIAASLLAAESQGAHRRGVLQALVVVLAIASAFALGRGSADAPTPPRAGPVVTEVAPRVSNPVTEAPPPPPVVPTDPAPATSAVPSRPPPLSLSARPDDTAAQRLLQDASAHWNDPTPDAALALAERALAATEGPGANRLVRGNVLVFLATLHQVKTGRLEDAFGRCEEAISLLEDATSSDARSLRARAMVLQANIIYDSRGDHEAALDLYRRAQEASQLASTADTAAQLCYRVARAPARAGPDRARYLELALRLSREAIDLVPAQVADGRARAHTLARYRLQLVLTLSALDRDQEAATERSAIPPADFDANCLYQLALVAAVENDLAKAGETLTRAMALRPTAEKRNLLRAFVRGEPDFQAGLAREDWRTLMADEPVR